MALVGGAELVLQIFRQNYACSSRELRKLWKGPLLQPSMLMLPPKLRAAAVLLKAPPPRGTKVYVPPLMLCAAAKSPTKLRPHSAPNGELRKDVKCRYRSPCYSMPKKPRVLMLTVHCIQGVP